jgi:hypothetical protein
MKQRQRFHLVSDLPRQETLQALARHYHHLQNEHKHAATGSSTRRRIEERFFEVREQFERALDEWVPEQDVRDAWHQHLHYRKAAPAEPPAIRPLIFSGISDVRSVVTIREHNKHELGVEVDGTLVERIEPDAELAQTTPGLRFRLDHTEFEETFNAPPDAVEALADSLADGSSPPWWYFADLYGDGLIDVNAGLTPRGRRQLATRASPTR